MIRLLIVLAVACLACRMIFGKWPWDFARRPRPAQERLRAARRLLGVTASADARQIREAHRRLAATCHPDRGGSHASQSELNAARDTLLAALPPSRPEPHDEP